MTFREFLNVIVPFHQHSEKSSERRWTSMLNRMEVDVEFRHRMFATAHILGDWTFLSRLNELHPDWVSYAARPIKCISCKSYFEVPGTTKADCKEHQGLGLDNTFPFRDGCAEFAAAPNVMLSESSGVIE